MHLLGWFGRIIDRHHFIVTTLTKSDWRTERATTNVATLVCLGKYTVTGLFAAHPVQMQLASKSKFW